MVRLASTWASFLSVILIVSSAFCDDVLDPQLDRLDERLTSIHEGLEQHKADPADADKGGWVLRSKHFVFGMPRLIDDRHDFVPPGFPKQAGISVVAREGFIVAHFDRMQVPLFVCQRWTTADNKRLDKLEAQDRPWKEDLELPLYARAGTSYDGTETLQDRGHMARHELNRAWGIDSSRMGCRMSNSAPQHKDVNRGTAWRALEDALRDIVSKEDSGIQVIWTINGTLYRDKENPDGEAPEQDFEKAKFIGDGFGVPFATYKVVGWFDTDGFFQARGYVFEQDDREDDPKKYLVPIKDIEKRAGVDFFPMLRNSIESLIESKTYTNMWE